MYEYVDEKDAQSDANKDEEDHEEDDDGGVCGGCEDDEEVEHNVEDDDGEEDMEEKDDNCDGDRPTKFHRTDDDEGKGEDKNAKGEGVAGVAGSKEKAGTARERTFSRMAPQIKLATKTARGT